MFRDTTSVVTARYPDDVPDWQSEFAGLPLVADLRIGDYLIVLVNAGDEFRPNPAISFMLNFDPLEFGGDEPAARAHLDEVWAGLSEGGRTLMPLDAYPFSPHYGWIEDRFGVSWQLILTDPAGEPRPFVIPQLMFAGPVEGRRARPRTSTRRCSTTRASVSSRSTPSRRGLPRPATSCSASSDWRGSGSR